MARHVHQARPQVPWTRVSGSEETSQPVKPVSKLHPWAHMYLKAIISLDWILRDIITCRQVNFPIQVSRLQREMGRTLRDLEIKVKLDKPVFAGTGCAAFLSGSTRLACGDKTCPTLRGSINATASHVLPAKDAPC